MSNAVKLTTSNFEDTVKEGVTLVDFWAEWCGPCRQMEPVIDDLAQDFADKAKITKVNIDDEQEIAEKYGIQAIPTLLIFKDGSVAQKFVGLTRKEELSKALESATS